jgi:hypothetical protein
MMGLYQAGIDHAAAGIQPALVRFGAERADFGDDAIANADRSTGSHRRTRAPGENAGGILDQQ